ncbi:CapA family protein [Cohnella algarum]|uniref:CapA family protein n=1 Tax=Cohnella algarum TaxID=2044859 RepID=UPI001967E813|nr:CapA family protein [Cohnella algarum]MBN2984005.1 CapA family protein [Cohnella algarum]
MRNRILQVAALLFMALTLAACAGLRPASNPPDAPAGSPSASARPSASPTAAGASASASPGFAETAPSAPSPSGTFGGEDGGTTGEPPPPEKAPAATEAKLVAVGDVMVHSPQLPAYYDASTDAYDFTPWFREVKPLLSSGDWTIANLETPLAGADLNYSGYPRFNAPEELADALVDAGVQIVSTANNHTLDRGFAGLMRTLQNVRQAGLIPVGTAESAWASRQPVIVERNGIRLGFLSYTYGTNGIPIPKDKPYAVNLISEEAIAEGIDKLRAEGADAIAVSLHFGNEYQRQPSDEQRSIARAAIEAGADIVLGSHPHVVQPYETIEVPDASRADGTRRGLIVYSMGNFISNQTGDWKDVGVIMEISLKKTKAPDGTAVTELNGVIATPTWVLIRKTGKQQLKTYTIVPLEQTLAAKSTKRWSAAEYARMEQLLTGIRKLLPAAGDEAG